MTTSVNLWQILPPWKNQEVIVAFNKNRLNIHRQKSSFSKITKITVPFSDLEKNSSHLTRSHDCNVTEEMSCERHTQCHITHSALKHVMKSDNCDLCLFGQWLMWHFVTMKWITWTIFWHVISKIWKFWNMKADFSLEYALSHMLSYVI